MSRPIVASQLFESYYTICRTKSVRASAEQLNISEAMLHRDLKLLEARFDGELIERSRDSEIQLTNLGEEVFLRAERLLEILSEVEAPLQNFGGGTCVSLFLDTMLPTEIITAVQSAFAANGESVQIQLKSEVSDVNSQRARSPKDTLGVVLKRLIANSDDKATKPIEIAWYGAYKNDVSVPVAVRPIGCPIRYTALSSLIRLGVPYHIELETDCIDQLKLAGQNGMVTALPVYRSGDLKRNVFLSEVTGTMECRIAVVADKRSMTATERQAQQAILTWLQDADLGPRPNGSKNATCLAALAEQSEAAEVAASNGAVEASFALGQRSAPSGSRDIFRIN